MRYKLAEATEIRESATGKARLLGVKTSKGMLQMWVPVSQSEFCTHGKWEVEEWWIEQKQDDFDCEIYTDVDKGLSAIGKENKKCKP